MNLFYQLCSKSMVMLSLSMPVLAQSVHNASNLYIAEGVEVSIQGTVVNSGFILNSGRISVQENWMNESTYQGLGSIALQGDDQIIANRGQAIEDLLIEGGGIKRVKGKLLINHQIDFINGIVEVQDSDTLMMAEQGEATSASSRSYVDGALTSMGTGYKFYPVGKNGAYRPVEFLNIQGLNPVLEVEVHNDLPSIRTDIPAWILYPDYWTRKTIEGSFTNTPVSLSYPLADSIMVSQVIIAQAEKIQALFSVIENVTIQSSGDLDVIESATPLTGNVFVLGQLTGTRSRPIYLSTTLSPNASEPENRTVKIFGDDISTTDFLFQVFNRWGNLVFESMSLSEMQNTGWDGKRSGETLSSGSYPYKVSYQDLTGRKFKKEGFISIVN